MQIRQSKTSEDLCGTWEDEESRFNRAQRTLQSEELCSQVPSHLTLKQTPKNAKKTYISAPEHTQKRPGAHDGVLAAQKVAENAQAHARGRQAPRPGRHMCLAHGLGRLAPSDLRKK